MGKTTPYIASFLIRFIYGAMNILANVAIRQGTSASVLVFYRNVLAAVLLLPVAFSIERKTVSPLSSKVCLKLFVHALYGMSASVNISFIGLNYASATSASAVLNLLPVLTFFLALLLGMESLKLKRFHGIVKISGIVLCAVGVTILALYQGPELKSFIHHYLFSYTSRVDAHHSRNWILGIFLQSSATVMWALWAIFQAPLLEEYPSKLLNTTIQIAFAAVQSFFMALVMERDFSRWKLGLDIGLVTAIYCGLVGCATVYYLQIWVIDKRGPVFLNMTAPLTLVFTVMISLLIGEAVTLGSLISGALMVGGLYTVLWGKSIEQEDTSRRQGGSGEKAACSDMEKQEMEAPVQATQD